MPPRPSFAFTFVVFLLVSGCVAKETPTPSDWPVRTFQFGRGFDLTFSASNAPDPFQSISPSPSSRTLKPLPAPETPEGELIENVRHNTGLLMKSDLLASYKFPVGSAFLYDPASGTMAARTTVKGMEILESYSLEERSKAPAYQVFDFQIFQAEAATVRRMLKEMEGKADNVAQFNELTGLVTEGKAKNLGNLRLETRSGQRATLESVREHGMTRGFTLDDKGNVEVDHEIRQVGLKVEIDPVLGPDGDTVDFNYELEYHFAPPVERREFAGLAPPLGRIEVPVTDFRVANINTASASLSGMTRLIGVWRPFGTPELDGADVLQIAFVRTDVVRNLPAENTALAARLKTIMDKACPIPAKLPEKPVLAKGMATRTFKAPPDFLSFGGEAKEPGDIPPDPFASTSTPVSKLKISTPEEVLKALGIGFPEGASASFSAVSGKLVVTNTPENLDAIEGYFDGGCHPRPQPISLTTHILQAEGSVMRQLVQETTGIADHTEVWKKAEALVAQGKATILSTQHVETRSGQRCSIEAVEEHSYVTKFAKNEAGHMTATYEMRPVGTRIEIDPIIGPDGYTIEMNLAPEYHHAPPTPPKAPQQPAGNAFQVQTSVPVFHASKLSTAITIGNGMTRLLGVWKPEGTPEFDKGDILQAAFIKADVVRIERE